MLCNVDKPVNIYIYLTVKWWYIYISVTSNFYFGRLEAATFVCLAIAVLLWIRIFFLPEPELFILSQIRPEKLFAELSIF